MKTVVIGEIGINCNGSVELVKKLIDECVSIGVPYVKFQKRTLPQAVPEAQRNLPKDTPWGKMTYLEYKYRMEYSKEQYDEIDRYCKEKGIEWSASVWDLEALEFMKQYNPPFIKIPSALLTNKELMGEASKWCYENDKILIVSIGMSTEQEISEAFSSAAGYFKRDNKPLRLVVMWCNSSYPAPINELNLSVIRNMAYGFKEVDSVNVGYSGHELGLLTTVYAVAMGATYIERHITLDKSMFGTDQSCSLHTTELKQLMTHIEELELAMGDGVIRVTDSQIPVRKKLRGV